MKPMTEPTKEEIKALGLLDEFNEMMVALEDADCYYDRKVAQAIRRRISEAEQRPPMSELKVSEKEMLPQDLLEFLDEVKNSFAWEPDEDKKFEAIRCLIEQRPKVEQSKIHKALAWTIGAGTRETADRAEADIIEALREGGVEVGGK